MYKETYYSILVWGHGLEYLRNIINMIDSDSDLEIVSVIKKKVSGMASFVKNCYSHEYAPWAHLKSKTKYLLNTPNIVCLIVIKCYSNETDFFGEDDFRHIESTKIRELKSLIRGKFNPRVKGEMTHDHIIHATDNETQTNNLLKLFDVRQGLKSYKSKNGFLQTPGYIKNFSSFFIEERSISEIRARIFHDLNKLVTVMISETPHYDSLINKSNSYEIYLEKYLGFGVNSFYSPDKFQLLQKNFKYLEGPYENSYILVKQHDDGLCIILDGLHRAAICAASGMNSIKVCVTYE